MAKFLITLLIFSSLSWAESKRRVDAVKWNPTTHTLTWVIARGEGVEARTTEYIIDMSSATMSFDGETRRFNPQEALRMHSILDFLVRYAAESVIWWEEGRGEPVGKRERVAAPPSEQKAPLPSAPSGGGSAETVTPVRAEVR